MNLKNILEFIFNNIYCLKNKTEKKKLENMSALDTNFDTENIFLLNDKNRFYNTFVTEQSLYIL